MRAISWILCIAALALAGCSRQHASVWAAGSSPGDADAGRRLLFSYGCGSCHTIPGVADAEGTVGPPLGGVAGRQYVAGVLQNTPANLALWIADPQKVEPGNAMPSLGVTGEQARQIAAYLYTLK